MKHKGKKFHKNKRLRKDCYDRNNARNRCILTRSKASGRSVSIEELNPDDYGIEVIDRLIGKIDEDQD